jgi:hypothetical protein
MSLIPREKERLPNAKTRVLIDTNIWRYVVNRGAQASLLRATREGPFEVQIAPSVLFETLRLKDVSTRDTLVHLMTNLKFNRLMPEAYSESMEILREIERLHPNWLRAQPDLQFFDRLRKDWSRKTGIKGFWSRCARSPESEARFIAQGEGDLIEKAEMQARKARNEMIEADWKRIPALDQATVKFGRTVPGWRGDDVEAWRPEGLAAMTYALSDPSNPYHEWMSPFIALDPDFLYGPAWGAFWLYEAQKSSLPRQWLRWAHSFVQRFRKVNSGSASDTQLYTYFVETDLVVTGDKGLLAILEHCRPFSPINLPEGRLLPAEGPGVTSLLRMLQH